MNMVIIRIIYCIRNQLNIVFCMICIVFVFVFVHSLQLLKFWWTPMSSHWFFICQWTKLKLEEIIHYFRVLACDNFSSCLKTVALPNTNIFGDTLILDQEEYLLGLSLVNYISMFRFSLIFFLPLILVTL